MIKSVLSWGEITGARMADEDEHRFMTYDEAAALLRIKPDSVRRRAASKRWPKRRGNDRKARVGIPVSIIPDDTPAPIPDDTPAPIPDATPAITTDEVNLRAELAAAKEALARAEGQAEVTAARLIDLAADRDAWRSQAERLALETRPVVPVSLWTRIFGSR